MDRRRRPGDGGRDRIDLDKMKKREWKNNGSAGFAVWPRENWTSASHIANESKVALIVLLSITFTIRDIESRNFSVSSADDSTSSPEREIGPG